MKSATHSSCCGVNIVSWCGFDEPEVGWDVCFDLGVTSVFYEGFDGVLRLRI